MEGISWQPPIQGKVKLKMKRRKSISDRAKSISGEGKPLSPLTNILNSGPNRPKQATSKRRNPFQCEENTIKRQKIDTSGALRNDLSLFKISHERSLEIKSDDAVKKHLDVLEEGFQSRSVDNFESSNNSEGQSKIPKDIENLNTCKGEEIPTDWSLKTKLKFRSDVAFSWCTNLKTMQSSKGIVNFVRCIPCELSNELIKDEERLKVEFKKSLSSWIHPNLPFVPSFPVSEAVLRSKTSSICKDEQIQSALMKSWSHSFQSIFTLSKSGFCPYFYFCCQNFTGLFIGSGVMDTQMIAVITPTTKGFREILRKDGIDFEMPLFEDESSQAPAIDPESSPNDFETDKENICKETEDEDFLSSLGLNQKNFASIRERKIADEISRLHSIDRRPKSTIIVRGGNVNALFNFLVNSDVILAQSGPYQGVPPTLLAPVAFEGASLKMLKCVQGPMKFQDKGCMKQVYGLELTGPILPTQFYNICNILKVIHSRYETSVASHGPSSALNCLQESPHNEVKAIEGTHSSNYGIDEMTFNYIKKNPSMVNGSLVGLTYQDGKFEWKMNNV